MTTVSKHEQGTFSWVELTTKDAAVAKKFYGGLFGWSFEDMPAGHPGMTYTMCSIDGKHTAGMLQMGEMPTYWSSYIAVDDIDATTKKVEPAGGKVLRGPFDVMDVGRMSVVQDPSGATVCLWQDKKTRGDMLKMAPGSLCWNELFSTDTEKAGKFYADVVGWTLAPIDMGPIGTYTLLKAAGVEDSVGGMMTMPSHMEGAPSYWLVYIAAEDVDAKTKEVIELGGKVLSQPMDIPDIGRFSVVQDPGGASFALYKNAH